MQSRPTRFGRVLTVLFGLAVSCVSLAQTRPPRYDEDVRRPVRPAPTRVPAAPASASGWVAVGNRNATDIAVGANGVVWIIGNDPAGAADKNIYRWDGNAFQQMVGQAVRIAVDPNGRAWVVQSTQGIFRWNGTSWDNMPGAAIDIGIGANGAVWVLGSDGTVWKWDGSNWRQIGGGAKRIAVDPVGNPWMVNDAGQIWHWKGTEYELLPGSARDIAVGPDGTVLIVSTTPASGGSQVQRWADGRWIDEGDGGGAAVAAGPSGALYVMKDTGALFRRSAGTVAAAPGSEPVAGTAPAATGDEAQMCWKKTYGRGAGTVPMECSSSSDKDAGLCYPKCPAGYKGVGPVCWQSCPDGFRDDGAFCAKPEAYGRGAGYPWQFGDALNDSGMISRCERDHGAGNCEKDGAIYYPKCKANFHKVGCCICSPDCPSGMPDIGVSCTKNTSTRGAGTVPSCGNLSYDAGLCYESCPRDYNGVGPLCWSKCPSDYPFPCGAGCAVNEAACAAAVTEMTLDTVSFAATMLSFPFGGPGVTVAAKTAAKAGAKAAAKVATQGGFKTLNSAIKASVKPAAKAFAKTFIKTYAKNPRNLAMKGYTAAKFGAKKGTSLHAANVAAGEMGTLKSEGQFDYSNLMMLDITGFSSMIYSFAKYGSCSVEDLASNVEEVDFGPGPASAADVRSIELTVQNPTTITEVTASPFSGCSIIPDADCAGKTLQPGQKCNINVKVAGSGRIVGEVHVYTTAYDLIPLAIGVKANSAATSECTFLPDADDAVNLSSLAGVWAWKDDQSQKFVIKSDGAVTSPLGSGRVGVVDPIDRTFQLAVGSAPATITLNAEHDRFTFSGGPNAGTNAVRRPWDSRCKPGEQFYAGLCYDVPVGYEITVPGFVGKPCPLGWRDDGVQCYPLWTGVKVPLQADPDGTLPMQRPILVTECPHYSSVDGSVKTCPANFKKTAICTCQAIPTSKEVKSLIGKIPGT
jgi:Tectonin domain